MGKNKHSKAMGFSTIFGEAEIHTIPKILKKWIPIAREKYGKTQTFQSNGFLKYFELSRNPYNSQNLKKVNFHSTGKVRENTRIFHSLRYLVDLELMRTHGIPNVCECTNSHKMEIFCGNSFPDCGILKKLEVIKFHTMEILWEKLIYSHTMGFE